MYDILKCDKVDIAKHDQHIQYSTYVYITRVAAVRSLNVFKNRRKFCVFIPSVVLSMNSVLKLPCSLICFLAGFGTK